MTEILLPYIVRALYDEFFYVVLMRSIARDIDLKVDATQTHALIHAEEPQPKTENCDRSYLLLC